MNQPRSIVLITGAGRGIGKATALLAAEHGYDLCLNYVADRQAAEAVRDTCQAHGVQATLFQADIADQAAVERLFLHCDDTLGPLTCLINNAGIVGRASRLEDLGPEALLRTFGVNVHGSIFCAQQAITRMARSKGGNGGVIINISSIAAVLGSPGEYVHYAASKGAIETLTIGLAKEVGPDGIRVNAVRAGTTDTDIHEAAGNPDRPKMVARTAPLRRVASPRDIAEAVLWLASDKASYTTGAMLNVSGGL